MELVNIFKLLRRWMWLIIAIVGLTAIALVLSLLLSKSAYEAQVKLQLTTPQQEDVSIYDQYRSISVRDLITVSRNNLLDVMASDEVRSRTFKALNIDANKVDYTLEVKPVTDTDYILVTVRAPSPELAATIANTHVDEAIKYYGELRAKSTEEEKGLYAEQLSAAEEAYRTATADFTAFKEENKIAVLSETITTEQRLLEQLQIDRDQRLMATDPEGSISRLNELIAQRQAELNRLTALEPAYALLEQTFQTTRTQYQIYFTTATEKNYRAAEQAFNDFKNQNKLSTLANDITMNNQLLTQLRLELDQRLLDNSNNTQIIKQADDLILVHKKELERLLGLEPSYSVLEAKVGEAQSRYQRILTKYTEADLTADVVRSANFIQVIQPAVPPAKAANSSFKLLALGIVGSLGLAIILAFVLDYFSDTRGHKLIQVKEEA